MCEGGHNRNDFWIINLRKCLEDPTLGCLFLSFFSFSSKVYMQDFCVLSLGSFTSKTAHPTKASCPQYNGP